MYSVLTKEADMTGVVSGWGQKLIALILEKELTDVDEWYVSACRLTEYAKENIDSLNLIIEGSNTLTKG